MKKKIASIAKITTIVLSVLVLGYSLLKLLSIARERGWKSLAKGLKSLSMTDQNIVDISGKGVKFLGRSNEAAVATFQAKLIDSGYKKVGKFGKSDLYEINGEEIIVKRSKIFNNYYLFEVYNDAYFNE